jgi:peptidoglycan hydrolase CwlO-like protein
MKIRVVGNNTIDMGGGKILSPDIVYDEKKLSAKEMSELVSQGIAEDADKIVKENKTAADEIQALKAGNLKLSNQIDTLSAEIAKKNEEIANQATRIDTLSAEIEALKKTQK